MKKTSTLLFAILATVFVFSTGTAFAQRGGQQQQHAGNRSFDTRGGNRVDNRSFDNRGGNRIDNRGFDNRSNRGFENRGFDNRGNRGFENRGYDNRDNRRGYDRDDRRGYDNRDYRNYGRYDNFYRGSRDWDRNDRNYDYDGYRNRYRSNWGFYGNRGGWRGGIWIGLPGDFNYEIVVYENVYDDYNGTYRVEHVAYWSNYYGGYVWYDVYGRLHVTY